MKILTAAAGLAAVLVSTGAAMAIPAQGLHSAVAVAPTSPINEPNSNRNLAIARVRIARSIDRLSNDVEDYGGYRVRAMTDLKQASSDLAQALEYWRNHRPHNVSPGGPLSTGSMGEPNESERSQYGSNRDIVQVRAIVVSVIANLRSDANDYGGYKEKAIERLEAARANLDSALAIARNKGVQNGSHNPWVSDANLQYVREHVEAATTRLQHDLPDYGGHRVKAISDLQQADTFIGDALAYDHSHDSSGKAITPTPIKRLTTVSADLTQAQSNDSLADAKQYLEKAIDALSRDAHDYGGYRVKALERMEAARTQLTEGLRYEHNH
jgi:tetratricopeptide (TPR) repeat protein